MLPSTSEVEAYLAHHLPLARGRGVERMAPCPLHDDRTASFAVNVEKAVAHCFSCGLEGTLTTIADQVGWDAPPWANGHRRPGTRPDHWHDHAIRRWYDYQNGVYVARVEYEQDGVRKKAFPVWCDGWGVKGKTVTRKLYNQHALADATDVFVAEGEQDVTTLKAHGLTAVSNLGGANRWRPEDAEAFTRAHHVAVLPDNDDAGRRHAETVAASLVGRVAILKVLRLPDLPEKGDVSDWLALHTDTDAALERLSHLVDGADPYAAPDNDTDANATTSTGPVLLDDVQVMSRPVPPALIAGVLTCGSLAYIYGPPASFKTAFTTGLGLAEATGLDFLGMAVEQSGPVVAVVAEGGGFYGERVHAWKTHYGLPLDIPVGFFTYVDAVNLLDPANVEALVALVAPLAPRLIILDTLGECLVGGSENDPQTMGDAIAGCRRLQRLGATVLCIHHTGWDESRERGHSKLRGAADTVLALSENDGLLRLTNIKQRDLPLFDPLHLRVQVVPTRGHLSACVLELADGLPPAELTAKQREVLQVLTARGASDRR